MIDTPSDHVFAREIDTRLFETLCRYLDRYEKQPNRVLQKAEELIRHGADLNAIGYYTDNPEVKSYLVAAAFDENVWAYSNKRIIKLLSFVFDRGFDPTVDQGMSGTQILSLLSLYPGRVDKQYFDIYRYLLEHNVDAYQPCLLNQDDPSSKATPQAYLLERIGCNFLDGYTGPECTSLFALYYFLSVYRKGRDASQIEFVEKCQGRSIKALSTPAGVKIETGSGDVICRYTVKQSDESIPILKLSLSESSLLYCDSHDLVVDNQDVVEFANLNLLPRHLVGRKITDIGYGYDHEPWRHIDPDVFFIVLDNMMYLKILWEQKADDEFVTITVTTGQNFSERLKKKSLYASCIVEAA